MSQKLPTGIYKQPSIIIIQTPASLKSIVWDHESRLSIIVQHGHRFRFFKVLSYAEVPGQRTPPFAAALCANHTGLTSTLCDEREGHGTRAVGSSKRTTGSRQLKRLGMGYSKL